MTQEPGPRHRGSDAQRMQWSAGGGPHGLCREGTSARRPGPPSAFFMLRSAWRARHEGLYPISAAKKNPRIEYTSIRGYPVFIRRNIRGLVFTTRKRASLSIQAGLLTLGSPYSPRLPIPHSLEYSFNPSLRRSFAQHILLSWPSEGHEVTYSSQRGAVALCGFRPRSQPRAGP
jgi:hypothetical protein